MTLFDRRYNQRDIPYYLVAPDDPGGPLQPAGDGDSYDTAILAETSLVSFYPFLEASGGTVSDKLGLHHGTLSGGYTSGEQGLVNGGYSVRLNGSSAYMTLANAFDLGDGPWSIEAWVKRYNLSMSSNQAIFGTTVSGTAGYLISAGSISPVNTFCGFAGAYSGPYTAAMTDTIDFHHIVLTKWDQTWTIYKDKVATTTTNACITTNGGLITIGNNPSAGSTYFNGWVTKIAIYKKALTLAEVTNHWNLGWTAPGG